MSIEEIATSFWKTDNESLIKATEIYGPSFKIDKHEEADKIIEQIFNNA
jgi:hypothetical protein